jgi:3-deoxy-D-manno-octulosonate 8-phosphate phosphatase (KDO 8-P phosphatase)
VSPLSSAALAERARAVKAIVLDCDGVLTEGSLFHDDEGDALRAFFVRDGSAIKLALAEGMKVAILSGRESRAVERRARELGLTECVQGRRRKLPAWEELLARLGLSDSEVAYMGDDFLDLPLLRRAGLAAAPEDAAPEARQAAHFVAAHAGGRGAVRDLVELILRSRGTWEAAIERDLGRD